MLVIVLLIIIAVAGWFIYGQIEQSGREYEVEQIATQDYEYFILRQDGNYGVINRAGDSILSISTL